MPTSSPCSTQPPPPPARAAPYTQGPTACLPAFCPPRPARRAAGQPWLCRLPPARCGSPGSPPPPTWMAQCPAITDSVSWLAAVCSSDMMQRGAASAAAAAVGALLRSRSRSQGQRGGIGGMGHQDAASRGIRGLMVPCLLRSAPRAPRRPPEPGRQQGGPGVVRALPAAACLPAWPALPALLPPPSNTHAKPQN